MRYYKFKAKRTKFGLIKLILLRKLVLLSLAVSLTSLQPLFISYLVFILGIFLVSYTSFVIQLVSPLMRGLMTMQQRYVHFPFVVMVFVLLALFPSSFAAFITWRGGTGDFTNASNWDPSVVPSVSDDVLIPGETDHVTVNGGITVESLNLSGILLITRQLQVNSLNTTETAQIDFKADVGSPSSLIIGSNVTFNGFSLTSTNGQIVGGGNTFNFSNLVAVNWENITFNNIIVVMRSDSYLNASHVRMTSNSVFLEPPAYISSSEVHWISHTTLTLREWWVRQSSILYFNQIPNADISSLRMEDNCALQFQSSVALIHSMDAFKLTDLYAYGSRITFRSIYLMKNIAIGHDAPNWILRTGAIIYFEQSHFEGDGFAIRADIDMSTMMIYNRTTIIFDNGATELDGFSKSDFGLPARLQFHDCNLSWPSGTATALPTHHTLFKDSSLTVNEMIPADMPWRFDGTTNISGSISSLFIHPSLSIYNSELKLPSIDFTPSDSSTQCVVHLGEANDDLVVFNYFRIGARSTYFVNAGAIFHQLIEGEGSFNISIYPSSRPVRILEPFSAPLNVDYAGLTIESNVRQFYVSRSAIYLRFGAQGTQWSANNVRWAVSGTTYVYANIPELNFYESNTLEHGVQLASGNVSIEGTLAWKLESWTNVAFLDAGNLTDLGSPSKRDLPMNFKVIIDGSLLSGSSIQQVPIMNAPFVIDPSRWSFVTKDSYGEYPLGDCFTIYTVTAPSYFIYNARFRTFSPCSIYAAPPSNPLSSPLYNPTPISIPSPSPSSPNSPPIAIGIPNQAPETIVVPPVTTVPLMPPTTVAPPPQTSTTSPTAVPSKKANVGLIAGLAVGIPVFIGAVIGIVLFSIWMSNRIAGANYAKTVRKEDRDAQKKWFKEQEMSAR